MSPVLPSEEPIEGTSAPLAAERIVRLTGYGMRSFADGYLFRPTSVPELREVLALACTLGRKVTLRGKGRSYGTAISAPSASSSTSAACGGSFPGTPPRASSTARRGLRSRVVAPHDRGRLLATSRQRHHVSHLGGRAGDEHPRKNNFRAGTLGDHVLEIDVLFPTGELRSLTPADDAFFAVISMPGSWGSLPG